MPVKAVVGSPVALVKVPDDGVPSAPPLMTGDPAVPTLVASAVATPVPKPVTLLTAGAHVAADIAVVRPLALLVTVTQDVALPKVPTLLLTVASVSTPVFAIEVLTLTVLRLWEEVLNVVLGTWLIVSPLVLQIANVTAAILFLLIGAAVVALAFLEIRDIRNRDQMTKKPAR